MAHHLIEMATISNDLFPASKLELNSMKVCSIAMNWTGRQSPGVYYSNMIVLCACACACPVYLFHCFQLRLPCFAQAHHAFLRRSYPTDAQMTRPRAPHSQGAIPRRCQAPTFTHFCHYEFLTIPFLTSWFHNSIISA